MSEPKSFREEMQQDFNNRLTEVLISNMPLLKLTASEDKKLRKALALYYDKNIKGTEKKYFVDTIMDGFLNGITKEFAKLMGIPPEKVANIKKTYKS